MFLKIIKKKSKKLMQIFVDFGILNLNFKKIFAFFKYLGKKSFSSVDLVKTITYQRNFLIKDHFLKIKAHEIIKI